jgi:hypothetical protein
MVAESFDKAQKRDILTYLATHGTDSYLVEHCQYFLTSYKNVQPLQRIEEEIKKSMANIFRIQALLKES